MRYIETIKAVDGVLQNIEFHRRRIVRTIGQEIDLLSEVEMGGVVKYRVVYDESGILDQSVTPYLLPNISDLKIVTCNTIDYSKKYEDRSVINGLICERGQCDDVLIVQNGFVTDTSFANVVFENSDGLFTPTTCLLRGTKREMLLDKKVIKEQEIKVEDIHRYHTIYIVNAMIELGEVIIRKIE